MNIDDYLKNRQNFSPDELQKHAGKYVAWSPDGSAIIASDDDPLKVVEAVKASGYDATECVLSSIPDCDSIVLGV